MDPQMAQFEQLVGALLNQDNSIRKQAGCETQVAQPCNLSCLPPRIYGVAEGSEPAKNSFAPAWRLVQTVRFWLRPRPTLSPLA